MPVTIPKEEGAGDKKDEEVEVRYPEGLPNVRAVGVEGLVAKCRVLVRRYIELQILDHRIGPKPARFDCMLMGKLEAGNLAQ